MPFNADDNDIWDHVPTVVKTTQTKQSYNHHFVRYFFSALGDVATNGYLFTVFNHQGIAGREGEEVWGYLQLIRWLKPQPAKMDLISDIDVELTEKDKAAKGYMHQIVWRDPVSQWAVDVHPNSEITSPVFQLANVTQESELNDLFDSQGAYNANRMTTTGGQRLMVLGDTPRAQQVDLLFWTIAVSFPADHYGFNASSPLAGKLAIERAANQVRFWRFHSGFKWRLKTSGALIMQEGPDDSITATDIETFERVIACYQSNRPKN